MQFTAEFNELLKSAYKFAEVIIKVKVIRYDTMRCYIFNVELKADG